MLFRSSGNAGGYAQTIIKDTSGNLYGAGWSGYAELGTGSAPNTNTGWNRILLPSDFTCANLWGYCSTGTTKNYLAQGTDNRLYAWGYGSQVGVINNNINNHYVTPFQINQPLGG